MSAGCARLVPGRAASGWASCPRIECSAGRRRGQDLRGNMSPPQPQQQQQGDVVSAHLNHSNSNMMTWCQWDTQRKEIFANCVVPEDGVGATTHSHKQSAERCVATEAVARQGRLIVVRHHHCKGKGEAATAAAFGRGNPPLMKPQGCRLGSSLPVVYSSRHVRKMATYSLHSPAGQTQPQTKNPQEKTPSDARRVPQTKRFPARTRRRRGGHAPGGSY